MKPISAVPRSLPHSVSQLVDTALEVVRREGGRSTTTRRIVLEALAASEDSGVSADDLAERIRASHPSFTTSTIYRCLEKFEELGVATHAHLGHGPAVWRLVDRPRWYLVCNRCGATVDVEPTVVEMLSGELRRHTGFRVDGHFALTGFCAGCAGPGGSVGSVGSGGFAAD